MCPWGERASVPMKTTNTCGGKHPRLGKIWKMVRCGRKNGCKCVGGQLHCDEKSIQIQKSVSKCSGVRKSTTRHFGRVMKKGAAQGCKNKWPGM